jgi:DNA-binding CsgD family transcriptional regulator
VGITDPLSGLVTMAQNCTPIGPPEAYFAAELMVPDVNRIAWLAAQPSPVGVLSEATQGQLESSYRYRHALRPSGIEHELRAALVIDGACWGYLVLLRGPEHPDFSRAEVRLVLSAIPSLAAGLRSGLLADAIGGMSMTEPGVAIVSDGGSAEATNAQAEMLFKQICDLHPAVQMDLPVPVAVLAASLQASGAPDMRRVLLSLPDSGWLVLEGSRVVREDGESRIVVTAQPAQPMTLVPLLLQARGLTEREIEVAQCVLMGMSTAEIADRLDISGYTVQDHLKAAFAKTGVHSRREFAQVVLSRRPG